MLAATLASARRRARDAAAPLARGLDRRAPRAAPAFSRAFAAPDDAPPGSSSDPASLSASFDVGVGTTLRVTAAQPRPAMWPADVTVETGAAYESVTVHARWHPAPSSRSSSPPPAPSVDAARCAETGDVRVVVTAPEGVAGFAAAPISRAHHDPPSSDPSDDDDDDDPSARPAPPPPPPPPLGRFVIRCVIPPRFCGVDVVSGGGDVSVESATEAPRVFVDTGGGTATFVSVRGATMAASTSGGDLRAATLVADAVLDTDGGDLRVGKLVGRRVVARTRGGAFDVESLFAHDADVATAGGDVTVGAWHVSGALTVRSRGGAVRVGGVGGDVGARAEVDTGGGDASVELHERLSRLAVATRGGNARVVAPEGAAVTLVASGAVDGREVRERVLFPEGGGGDAGFRAEKSGFGGALRVAGSREDEAARKVLAASEDAVVVVDATREGGASGAVVAERRSWLGGLGLEALRGRRSAGEDARGKVPTESG